MTIKACCPSLRRRKHTLPGINSAQQADKWFFRSMTNILIISHSSIILVQCLDCVVLLGHCQPLGPEFNLEEAQRTLEDAVFLFKGRKRAGNGPLSLSAVCLVKENNWGRMNLKALPIGVTVQHYFPSSIYFLKWRWHRQEGQKKEIILVPHQLISSFSDTGLKEW